jgi:hypothetical protein
VNDDKIITLALPVSQCNNQLNMKTMTTTATMGRRVGEDCGEGRSAAKPTAIYSQDDRRGQ